MLPTIVIFPTVMLPTIVMFPTVMCPTIFIFQTLIYLPNNYLADKSYVIGSYYYLFFFIFPYQSKIFCLTLSNLSQALLENPVLDWEYCYVSDNGSNFKNNSSVLTFLVSVKLSSIVLIYEKKYFTEPFSQLILQAVRIAVRLKLSRWSDSASTTPTLTSQLHSISIPGINGTLTLATNGKIMIRQWLLNNISNLMIFENKWSRP